MRYHCLFCRGFSLIELLTVIAIISILAVIAFPSYQDYIRAARFTEIITQSNLFKTAITLAIQEDAPMAELKNGKHGIPATINPTKYLASIIVDNGIITATASELLDNTTYILKPDKEGNVWKLSGTCKKKGWCHE